MKVAKIIFVFVMCCAFISCEKEDDSEPTIYYRNLHGKHFSEVIETNNLELVRVYETVDMASDKFVDYNRVSFPGNNFIQVWLESDGKEFAHRNYNLDRVIWYELNRVEYKNTRVEALVIEFDK